MPRLRLGTHQSPATPLPAATKRSFARSRVPKREFGNEGFDSQADSASLRRMSAVHEIEDAVGRLSRQDLSAFREWFAEFDATAWDRQFAEDVAAGRLDDLADEAIRGDRASQ